MSSRYDLAAQLEQAATDLETCAVDGYGALLRAAAEELRRPVNALELVAELERLVASCRICSRRLEDFARVFTACPNSPREGPPCTRCGLRGHAAKACHGPVDFRGGGRSG